MLQTIETLISQNAIDQLLEIRKELTIENVPIELRHEEDRVVIERLDELLN